MPEFVFKFYGQLFLFTNGPWRPTNAFLGSDRRRHAGLTYNVHFVDQPVGLNERRKDSSIKTNLINYFAEFWFVAKLFWLVPRPRPGSDRTLPLCPNSASLILTLMNVQDKINIDITENQVDALIAACLMPYVLSVEKPSTASEIILRFSQYMLAENRLAVDEETAKKALETKLYYKAGHSLAKQGIRKKTTVNVYLLNNRVRTIGAAPLA